MTETYVKEEVAWRTMVKVPLSNSFLERRDGRWKFSESLGAGAPAYMSADLTWIRKWLESLVHDPSELDRRARLDSRSIATSGQDQARTGRSGPATNLRSHFVIRPRRAPEWLHARFFWAVFLANDGELTGKTFTTSLNTTNPNRDMCEIPFPPTFPLRCPATLL